MLYNYCLAAVLFSRCEQNCDFQCFNEGYDFGKITILVSKLRFAVHSTKGSSLNSAFTSKNSVMFFTLDKLFE